MGGEDKEDTCAFSHPPLFSLRSQGFVVLPPVFVDEVITIVKNNVTCHGRAYGELLNTFPFVYLILTLEIVLVLVVSVICVMCQASHGLPMTTCQVRFFFLVKRSSFLSHTYTSPLFCGFSLLLSLSSLIARCRFDFSPISPHS